MVWSWRVNVESRMAQRKILLIDDSEVSLHFTSRVLAKAGFEVRTTLDVHDLQNVLGGWRPDVILTDVDMPGLTGAEVERLYADGAAWLAGRALAR